VARAFTGTTCARIAYTLGDHFFGINALKRRFPNAKAVSTAAVVDAA
jgi:hypothetical protein